MALPKEAAGAATKQLFTGIEGAVDAASLGTAVGATMLWNSMQNNVTAWMLGELLISVLISSSMRSGLIRNITLGVEAGAIASFLAPWFAKSVEKTGTRVTSYRPTAGGCPGCRSAHQAQQPVSVSFPAAAVAQAAPRGVSVLDI